MGKSLIFGWLFWFLAGCPALHAQPVHPVVTGIEITVEENGREEILQFSTPEETSLVLNYLRLLRPSAQAEVNPEYVAGAMYTFSLELSDGSRQTMRQKGQRYFMGRDGIWYAIEPYSEAKLDGVLAFCRD